LGAAFSSGQSGFSCGCRAEPFRSGHAGRFSQSLGLALRFGRGRGIHRWSGRGGGLRAQLFSQASGSLFGRDLRGFFGVEAWAHGARAHLGRDCSLLPLFCGQLLSSFPDRRESKARGNPVLDHGGPFAGDLAGCAPSRADCGWRNASPLGLGSSSGCAESRRRERPFPGFGSSSLTPHPFRWGCALDGLHGLPYRDHRFCGLIVPHMMRLVLGPGHRKLLPSSALAGGVFLVWADVFARLVLAPAELPVGVVTALVGVPFFLFLLRRAR